MGGRKPGILRRLTDAPRRTAAATLVGLAVGAALLNALWSVPAGSSMAFAEVVQRLRDARTLTYDSVAFSLADGEVLNRSRVSCMTPGKWHEEFLFPNPAEQACNIWDIAAGKIVTLYRRQKVAIVMPVQGKTAWDPAREIIEFIQSVPEGDARRLGEREIDGVRAVGFESDFPGGKTTVWVDAKTGDPLRIEDLFKKSLAGSGAELEVMNNFKLNEQLDPALFDTEPPPGYKIRPNVTLDLDATTADYLVGVLKTYAKYMDGEFPARLLAGSQDGDVRARFGVGGLEPRNARLEQLAQIKAGELTEELPAEDDLLQLISYADGFCARVADLPRGKRWQYFPGVKLGQKDRLVFWYLDAKTNKYSAVYGDLRIETVTKDQLPASTSDEPDKER